MQIWDVFVLRYALASLPALLRIVGLTSASCNSLARLSANIQLGLVTEGAGRKMLRG